MYEVPMYKALLPLASLALLASACDLYEAYDFCDADEECGSGQVCDPQAFVCVDAPDTKAPDAGSSDAGEPDAGFPDAGFPDAGIDAGEPDAGIDAGIDAGQPDAGIDAGEPDAGIDAGEPDAGTDAGSADPLTVVITSGPLALASSPEATFTFECSAPPCAFACTLDDDDDTTCESGVQYTVADGDHRFEVQAVRIAGGAESAPVSFEWTVDTLPPPARIDFVPDFVPDPSVATLGFSCDEPGCTFTCARDDGAMAACTSPHDFPSVPAGPHTYHVHAHDPAGNVTPLEVTLDLAVRPLVRVSVGPDGAEVGPDPYENPFSGLALSSDGRFVVFSTKDANLPDPTSPSSRRPLLHDRLTRTLTSLGPTARFGLDVAGISADGSVVLLRSTDPDLHESGTTLERVFAFSNGELLPLTPGIDTGGEYARDPHLSADGAYACFTSNAALVAADLNQPGPQSNGDDVYRVHVPTGLLELVSVAPPTLVPDGASRDCSLSADGHKVAFLSEADNLVASDGYGGTDVFVRDMNTGTTSLVSLGLNDQQATGNASFFKPVLSADGAHVAFLSNAPLGETDNGYRIDVFLRRLTSPSATQWVNSALSLQEPAEDAHLSVLDVSADGRFVLFASDSDNHVLGDPAVESLDYFVRDVQSGTTHKLNVNDDSVHGDAVGLPPNNIGYVDLADDGTCAAFVSYDSNLVAGDTNGTADVFVKQIRP